MFLVTSASYGYYGTDASPQPQQAAPAQQPVEAPKPSVLDYDKLYKESMDSFPADTPPLIKEFFKNPDDPKLSDLAVKFLDARIDLANRAAKVMHNLWQAKDGSVASNGSGVSSDEALLAALRAMGTDGYKLMYFYSSTCPHCINSEQMIKIISALMPVERIEAVMENKGRFDEWRVEGTPTLFFIKGETAYKMEGEVTQQTLSTFLQTIPAGQ